MTNKSLTKKQKVKILEDKLNKLPPLPRAKKIDMNELDKALWNARDVLARMYRERIEKEYVGRSK